MSKAAYKKRLDRFCQQPPKTKDEPTFTEQDVIDFITFHMAGIISDETITSYKARLAEGIGVRDALDVALDCLTKRESDYLGIITFGPERYTAECIRYMGFDPE